jgi:putative transposase
LIDAALELAQTEGAGAVCEALGISRTRLGRRRTLKPGAAPAGDAPARRRSWRRLSDAEEKDVLDLLHTERFVDLAPAQVYTALLDEGRYACSISTMYRLLNKNREVKERRRQLRHPEYARPELLATGPNQLWSWDITKLRGPVKYAYYYLYVIMDVYSRYVVGWTVASRESAEIATELINESCLKQQILPQQLTIHADRGSAMTSKAVAELLSSLCVTKTHSRPHVSNDNCYSEAQFKTLKYRPDFPERFGSEQDSRCFCRAFFGWYNTVHYHSGIGLMTPETVHYQRADAVLQKRRETLMIAYEAHPERHVRKVPKPTTVPEAVWINPPQTQRPGDDRL